MRKYIYFLAFCLFTGIVACNLERANKTVLIYTKNGEGYVHDNIPESVKALKEICDGLGIAYEVSEDPAIFNNEFSDKFDAVIFSNTNNEAFYTDKQRAVFQNFIKNGGGYVGIHSACGSERDWPWYWTMAGGKFVSHPPFQPFDLKVVNKNHPSTEFLPDIWNWEDECYYMNQLNPDINVLLVADLTTLVDPNMDKFPGEMFGKTFPLAWYHQFDGGREFFTALGHDPGHYMDENFRRHLSGGIQWALKLKDM